MSHRMACKGFQGSLLSLVAGVVMVVDTIASIARGWNEWSLVVPFWEESRTEYTSRKRCCAIMITNILQC